MKEHCSVLYFSGTGSTKLVATKIYNQLINTCFYDVEIMQLTTSFNNEIKSDLLIILYPVHAFNPPGIVVEALKRTSFLNKPRIALIAVSGGGAVFCNNGCFSEIETIFKQKDHQVFYEEMIVMPSNFVIALDEKVNETLLRVLNIIDNEIVNDIISGKSKKVNASLVNRFFAKIGRLERKFSNKFDYSIETNDNCVKCLWCLKNCPANNIELINEKISFKHECSLCLKCLYGCSYNALKLKKLKFVILKEGYVLKETKEIINNDELLLIIKSIKNPAWFGVKKYLKRFIVK